MRRSRLSPLLRPPNTVGITFTHDAATLVGGGVKQGFRHRPPEVRGLDGVDTPGALASALSSLRGEGEVSATRAVRGAPASSSGRSLIGGAEQARPFACASSLRDASSWFRCRCSLPATRPGPAPLAQAPARSCLVAEVAGGPGAPVRRLDPWDLGPVCYSLYADSEVRGSCACSRPPDCRADLIEARIRLSWPLTSLFVRRSSCERRGCLWRVGAPSIARATLRCCLPSRSIRFSALRLRLTTRSRA